MGLIQSLFCSMTFCVERVLTWTCCAFVLMLLMFTIILLMTYGISVGYHYAQKELADMAKSPKSKAEPTIFQVEPESRPVEGLVAVSRSEVENTPLPILEAKQTKKRLEQIYLETSKRPSSVLATERPIKEPEFSTHERELARRIIGRFSGSRRNVTSTTIVPFLRLLNII